MHSKLESLTRVLAKVLACEPQALLENFRPAKPDEVDELVRFRAQNLNESLAWDDREYFRWRYNFDEAESEVEDAVEDTGFPVNRVWILKINQQLLGMVGVIETPIRTGNHILTGAHPLDLLVEKKLDGFGLGAWMNYVIASRYDPLLVIGANKNSQSIVRRIFHPMPNRELWKYFLDTRFIFEKFNFPKPLAHLLAFVSEPILSLARTIKRKNLSAPNLNLKELETFDASLDKDLAAMSASWPVGTFFRPRTSQFLNQRFLACPTCEFNACGLFQNEKLVAYLVYRVVADTTSPTRAEIADFFWRNPAGGESKAECLTLLLEFARLIKTKGVRLVQLTSYGKYPRPMLRAAGFVPRTDEHLLFSIGSQAVELQDKIYNSDNWFLTDADAHGAGI